MSKMTAGIILGFILGTVISAGAQTGPGVWQDVSQLVGHWNNGTTDLSTVRSVRQAMDILDDRNFVEGYVEGVSDATLRFDPASAGRVGGYPDFDTMTQESGCLHQHVAVGEHVIDFVRQVMFTLTQKGSASTPAALAILAHACEM
ncbi:MAG: hypothetical protein ACYDAB_08175 [bacterium]